MNILSFKYLDVITDMKKYIAIRRQNLVMCRIPDSYKIKNRKL